jgi:hypothetical protein
MPLQLIPSGIQINILFALNKKIKQRWPYASTWLNFVTTSNESCLRSEDDEKYNGWCELAACEVGEEAVVWVERLGVHNAQYVERTAHCSLHHNGETEKATFLELCGGVPTGVTQVNPKHQDKDLTWRPSCKWIVCYINVLNISDSQGDKIIEL